MSNHKQASLFKVTHSYIEDIAEVMNKNPIICGKVSKADVVHQAVLQLHKKLVKGSTVNHEA